MIDWLTQFYSPEQWSVFGSIATIVTTAIAVVGLPFVIGHR